MELTVNQARSARWAQVGVDVRFHLKLIWAEVRRAYWALVRGQDDSSLADSPLVVAHALELLRLTDDLATAREPKTVDYADYPGLHLMERLGPSRAFFASQQVILELADSHPEFGQEQLLDLIRTRLELRLIGTVGNASLLRSISYHPAGRSLPDDLGPWGGRSA